MEKTAAKRVIALCAGILVMVSSAGCEALSRKFIRKSKKEKEPVQMVLVPEAYTGPAMAPEEKYRHYFFYWESWHEELIQALNVNGNKKKQADSAEQAVKNLAIVRGLLDPERQKIMDGYITRLNELSGEVKSDTYNSNAAGLCSRAEALKRDIKRDFSCSDVKDALQ
ncbi:MAG: hypothetical protein WC335_03110 [Candidatus Omnitrophota bacterium]|jgi:hypothetical protein